MTVTSTVPTTGVIRSLGDQSVKLSAVFNNSAPAIKEAPANAASVNVVAPDEVKQFPPLSLRVETLNVGYVTSDVGAVDVGAAQVNAILGQLRSIAVRASSSGLSDSQRAALTAQFKALAGSIRAVPPSPQPKLDVDGTLQALGSDASAIDAGAPKQIGFTSNELIGGADVSTEASAKAALETISNAQATVVAQQAVIAQLKDIADFASASVESALQNQDALRSTFTPDDIAGKAGSSLIDALRAQSEQATIAQTSKLPNGVLKLIS
jgi:hypothetical protein